MRFLKKYKNKSIPVWTGEIKEVIWTSLVKYNIIYAFGENNKSGIRSRQVPVWRGLIFFLSEINSGPNNYYGIDRIPVGTGSGMYRLHGILSYVMIAIFNNYKLNENNLIIQKSIHIVSRTILVYISLA